jgi:hypothetical protein
LLADTAAVGRQENSKQMHLTIVFTIPLERRNRQPSIESELKWVNANETVQ